MIFRRFFFSDFSIPISFPAPPKSDFSSKNRPKSAIFLSMGGRPNYANITFFELFVGPCIDRPEVMDKGPDYANALFSEFCVGARCPPMLAPSKVVAIEVQRLKEGKFQAG